MPLQHSNNISLQMSLSDRTEFSLDTSEDPAASALQRQYSISYPLSFRYTDCFLHADFCPESEYLSVSALLKTDAYFCH